MAWHNMQQTMRLLTALQDMGKDQKDGGGWWKSKKGGGKGEPPATKKKWCIWKGCEAALAGKPTMGDKLDCHSCGRHFSQEPPLEQVIQWAYDAKLKAATQGGDLQTKGGGKGNAKGKDTAKGKSAGKGKAVDPPPQQQQQQQAGTAADTELRARRLEEFKAAKAGHPPQGHPPQPAQSLLQGQAALAVARQVVLPPPEPPQAESKWLAMTLDANTSQIMVDLQEALESVAKSVSLDLAPTSYQPSLTPQEELDKLTAATKSCATAADKARLEDEIAQTKAMLAMSGPQSVMDMLTTTLKSQEAELEKLSKKAHGNAMQKASLEEAKAALVKEREARAERAIGGKAKTDERKRERLRLLKQVVDAVEAVKSGVRDHENEYLALHTRRQTAREAHDKDVDRLLDELIAERKADAEAEKLAAANGAPQTLSSAMEVSPPAKQDALAAALEEIEKHKELITQLQAGIANSAPATASQATASAAATEAGKAKETAAAEAAKQVAAANQLKVATGGDNDPMIDLFREMTPDVNELPDPNGPMLGPDKKQVDTLSAFFSAMPWGSSLPALTFHVLGAHPSIVHGLIGDKMWQETWGEKHERITTMHMVPYSILNVAKLALERMKIQPDVDTLADGKARWMEAGVQTSKRRQLSSPY